jgi:hypothetical protein
VLAKKLESSISDEDSPSGRVPLDSYYSTIGSTVLNLETLLGFVSVSSEGEVGFYS